MLNLTSGLLMKTFLYVVIQNDTETNAVVDKPMVDNCFGIYGCFPMDGPWKVESIRPVALVPTPPDVMNVRYPMFRKGDMTTPYILDPNDPDKIRKANINKNGPFYFIAHGYLERGDKQWIQKLTESLLNLGENVDATVIVVDWRGGSSPPYSQAVANIRLVGAMTAHLIYDIYLHLNLKNLDRFHFIGHSLGAHCGGYTGATLKNHFGLKLGRISGLDPAEPHFGNTDDIVKLDRSDAKFVDIIHTDASLFISGGLGISETIGHVDFFPNGGSNQPGCNQGMMHYINSKQSSLMRGIQKFLSCNHVRSYEYFTESVLSLCPFYAAECSSYQEFLKGGCFKCGAKEKVCLPMGYHSFSHYKMLLQRGLISQNKQIKAFLMSGDSQPFCKIHYRVTVNISASMESSTHGGDVGRLWMVLIGKNGERSERIPLEDHAGHHKPGTQRTLLVSVKDMAIPDSAMIEWEFETNLLNPLTWRILMSPRVFIAWIHIESLEYETSITVCPQQEQPVQANFPSHFRRQQCTDLSPIRISTSSTFHY